MSMKNISLKSEINFQLWENLIRMRTSTEVGIEEI
jgi:hypothetical protein